MRYSVSDKGDKPRYLQLYEQLRDDIVSGAYIYGSRLPSKRILSEETDVSVITVCHAYELLCEEGYAESKERSGYFVIYKQDDFTSHGNNFGATFSDISNNKHDLTFVFPFTVVAKTMRKVLSDYGESIFDRSPNKGCLILRQALSLYLKRNTGIDADANRIIVGAGAEYLYSLVVQLLGKDRIYALEKPSYKKIKQVYEAHGARCEMLTLGNNGILSDELVSSQATVLHVTPFNSFPSKITASASKRREYLRWATERNGYIVEDNYDSELTVSKKNEESVFSLDKDDRVIYINTFSRTVSPSVRAGYMILPERELEKFDSKIGFYSCTLPMFDQLVLAQLINGGEFERHINRVRREKRNRLK